MLITRMLVPKDEEEWKFLEKCLLFGFGSITLGAIALVIPDLIRWLK